MIFACCYLDATSESCLAAEQTSPRRVSNAFGSALPICAPSDMPPGKKKIKKKKITQLGSCSEINMFSSDMTGTVSL